MREAARRPADAVILGRASDGLRLWWPAGQLADVTSCNSAGQIRAQAGGLAQVGVTHGLIGRQPGVGQQADAAG